MTAGALGPGGAMETILEANASDAETRMAALESSTSVTAVVSGDFTVTSNLTVSGTSLPR